MYENENTILKNQEKLKKMLIISYICIGVLLIGVIYLIINNSKKLSSKEETAIIDKIVDKMTNTVTPAIYNQNIEDYAIENGAIYIEDMLDYVIFNIKKYPEHKLTVIYGSDQADDVEGVSRIREQILKDDEKYDNDKSTEYLEFYATLDYDNEKYINKITIKNKLR